MAGLRRQQLTAYVGDTRRKRGVGMKRTRGVVCRTLLYMACFVAGTTGSGGVVADSSQAKKVEKIDPVAVVGCLREAKPNEFMLVGASDPVPSTANAPSPKELAALPKGGKRSFQLIGVTVFNLAAHRGHTVAVKGLPIVAKPVDRLNITSVTMIASTCAPSPGFN
jgi:hypothetical protein